MEKVLNIYFDDFITCKITGYVKDIEENERRIKEEEESLKIIEQLRVQKYNILFTYAKKQGKMRIEEERRSVYIPHTNNTGLFFY